MIDRSFADQPIPAAPKSALPRKLSWTVVASLLLGLVAGIGLRLLPGQGWTATAVEWFDVVGTMWVNAIRMTVIPLVVPLLIGSIAGAKSGRAVGRLGVATGVSFVGLVAVISIATALIAPTLFSGLHVDPQAIAGLRESAAAETLPTGDASLSG